MSASSNDETLASVQRRTLPKMGTVQKQRWWKQKQKKKQKQRRER